ncbi:MAG: hypothetical protein WKF95_09490, partial [Rubrobacter sp.]
ENSSRAPTATTGFEPPGSTLSHDGETVEAGLGGYCWSTDQASSCVDAIGISLGDGKLTVPPGAPLSFAYKGDKLDSLGVTAYEVEPDGGDSNRIEDGILVPPYTSVGKEKQPEVRRSGDRARIFARLPAGEYVFDVRARMPEGDASYGFHLVVKASTTSAERTVREAGVEQGGAVVSDGVVFMTREGRPGDPSGMMALTRAELEVDGEGCLRFGAIDGPGGYLPVWPPGYSLKTEGDDVRVLDERGRLVARAGDKVEAGGGGIGRSGTAGGYEELRQRLDVPGKCTGIFWIITPPVEEIDRG